MNEQNANHTIEFNGQCAFAVSLNKLDVQGRNIYLDKDGKRYCFSNSIAKFLFSMLPKRIEKAKKNWLNK